MLINIRHSYFKLCSFPGFRLSGREEVDEVPKKRAVVTVNWPLLVAGSNEKNLSPSHCIYKLHQHIYRRLNENQAVILPGYVRFQYIYVPLARRSERLILLHRQARNHFLTNSVILYPKHRFQGSKCR